MTKNGGQHCETGVLVAAEMVKLMSFLLSGPIHGCQMGKKTGQKVDSLWATAIKHLRHGAFATGTPSGGETGVSTLC